MKQYKLIALLFVFLCSFAEAQNIADEIDELVKASYPTDQPGVALLVSKNGKVVYRGASGQSNLELGVPMKPENVFELASITKQFTAVAILMLEEQGKLSVDDEITKFIPDYPTQNTKITIHHLLNHTSGVKSYTSMNLDSLARLDKTPTELIDVFKNEPMDFKPGERFLYNNSGYVLLGYIIEKVSGKTYEDFIEQEIFQPLEMANSRYGKMSELIPNRANGYMTAESGFRNADYLSLTLPYAAGSLMSTVDDMLKWQIALSTNRLIKKESLDKAINGSTLNNGDAIDYGYGLSKGDLKGSSLYTHSGGIFGYSTNGIYFPEEEVYVIGLTNCSCKDIGTLTQVVGALAIGKRFPSKKDVVSLSEAQLKKWVGAYEFDGGAIRRISLKDDILISQRDGSTEFKIYPLTEDHFIFEEGTIAYHFSIDKNGKKQVKMTNLGGEILGVETTKKPAAEREGIAVKESVLQQYVGSYELQPGFDLNITLEAQKLYIQATGQPKLQLHAEANEKFFLKEVPAEIVFVKDDSGKYATCILHQNGQKMPAKRKE